MFWGHQFIAIKAINQFINIYISIYLSIYKSIYLSVYPEESLLLYIK